MSVRGIHRTATVKGFATPTNAPIYVDSDDDILKYIPAGSGTTEVQVIDASASQTLTNKTITAPVLSGSVTGTYTLAGTPTITSPVITNPSIQSVTPVNVTDATVALTAALHGGRVITLNRETGIAVTLPVASGTGVNFRIVVGTTFTGASTIKVANGTDVINGTAVLFQDDGNTVVGFNATASDDTIDLLGTSNSTGGIIGAMIDLTDVAAGKWHVRYVSDAGGTEATPFSNGVS
jgi:hypothetical protein